MSNLKYVEEFKDQGAYGALGESMERPGESQVNYWTWCQAFLSNPGVKNFIY